MDRRYRTKIFWYMFHVESHVENGKWTDRKLKIIAQNTKQTYKSKEKSLAR